MHKKLMYKRLNIVIFISVLLFLSIAASLCFSVPTTAKAQQNNLYSNNYPHLSEIGNTENKSMLPSFLYRDEARDTAKTLMQNAYTDMIDSGFDMGVLWKEEAAGSVREWSGYGVQEFRNGDHTANMWGRKHGYLVIGTIGEGIMAGAVVNDIMIYWVNNTSSVGYPIGNRFKVSGDSLSFYQNFEKGYIKETDSVITYVSGKHIDGSGTVSDRLIIKIETGLINLKDIMPYWAIDKEIEISAAFKQAELRINQSGFDMGDAVKEVEVWRPEESVLSQTFIGGDNTGNPFGWGMQGRLMLNDGGGKAFALVGAQLTKWASAGGLGIVGYPLSDVFEYGNAKYQAFSGAYMLIESMPVYSEIVKVSAGQLSLKDRYEAAAEDGLTNVSYNIFSAYRNYNNFIGNFGIPKEFVKMSGNTYYQEFFGGDHGEIPGFIAQKGVYGFPQLIRGEAAKIFQGDMSAIGAPMGAAFEIGGKTYQNFENGYVDFSLKSFIKGKKYSAVNDNSIELVKNEIHEQVGRLYSGEGYDASVVKEDFKAAVKNLQNNGFDIYAPLGDAIVKNGRIIQYFENTSSLADGKAAIVKADADSKAYALYGAAYTMFEFHGSIAGEAEYVLGEPFAYGKRIYQNFESSFVSYNAKGKTEFVSGYHVSDKGIYLEAGTPFPAEFVPDYVGKFGDINRIPVDYRDKQTEVQATFKKEYARLISLGFFPGNPDEELVHQWAPGSLKWLNQTFKNGDSQAEAFGNANAMKIFMMDLETGARSIIDSMLTAWISYGSLNGPGYPIDNEVYHDGNLYQNFYGGYIVCPGGDPDAALYHIGEKFTLPAVTDDSTPMEAWAVALISIGCTLVVCAGALTAVYFIIKAKKGKIEKGGRA